MNMDDIKAVFAISKEARQIALRDAIATAENLKITNTDVFSTHEVHNNAIDRVVTAIRCLLED